MALYVDFEKLKECFNKPMPYYSIGKLLEEPQNTAEIIRCKNCKHSLFKYCDLIEHDVGNNTYCCWAERRTE